ncbi:hypothetical protein [Thermosipho sp. 1074]|uniref:hypothetical protein n=1 Tax=Thermosipho sp. 1074 TaxID=1643331 RepID=UPI0009859578|nr:hypothetical protein [Thermosipho sp. 1074]
MSRGRWIRGNSYKYKFQIVLVIMFFLLSSCALTLDKILPNTTNKQIINLNAYFQAFYSDNLKRIFLEKLGISEDDFVLDNIKSVNVKITLNGEEMEKNVISSGILIKPMVTVEKNISSINMDVEVIYTLIDGIYEKTYTLTAQFNENLDLSKTNNLYFIIYLEDEGTGVKLNIDPAFEIKFVETDEKEKIYYVTPDNKKYYSILKNENIENKIILKDVYDEVQVFSFP